MASGDPLIQLFPASRTPTDWLWVAFTSGSTEPSPGDVIHGDTSDATAYLEIIEVTSGTWGGGDAAGWMLLSNWDETAWTSAENFTANTTTPGNHGTLTATPLAADAEFQRVNNVARLAFDDSANEIALFLFMLPAHYGGSGVTETLVLSAASNTGDVSFRTYWRSFTDDADNFLHTTFNAWSAAQANAAIDAPTAVGEPTYDTITHTDGAQMDSAAAGEVVQVLLVRDAQDATNDDLTGDAYWISMAVVET